MPSDQTAASPSLQERVDRAVDEAHDRQYAASTKPYAEFWRGREEALKDVRLWIAQEARRV